MEINILDIMTNRSLNLDDAEIVKQKLEEKYKEEFSIKMIGNREMMSFNGTVTTYCCPKNNEKLIFTAIYNKNQDILEDDYRLRSISVELEESITKEFKKKDIDVVTKAKIMGKNNVDKLISVQEFLESFKEASFLTYIISKDVISDEVLEKIYTSIMEKYKNIYLKTFFYTINKEEFEKCCELENKSPIISNSIIEKNLLKDEVITKIFEGKIYRIK